MVTAPRPAIAPVPAGVERPRWSVMIPAYNRGDLLQETLLSVLAQAPTKDAMQIEVVDDASEEELAPLVETIGASRVTYFRQPSNVGQLANLATCLARARGEIVHLLHSDDIVRPGFYAALERGFEDETVGAAFCRWELIDENGARVAASTPERATPGLLEDALCRLASEQRIVTPSIAVRRSVWEELGGFDPRLRCAEDWEMWVRIASRYSIWYDPDLLASYRVHSDSTSRHHFDDASELHYTMQAMRAFRPLLPAERARGTLRAARKAYSRTALGNAGELARAGRRDAMQAHLYAALRLEPSLATLWRAARIWATAPSSRSA